MKKRTIQNERQPLIIHRPKDGNGFWSGLLRRLLGKWWLCALIVSSANASQVIRDSGPPLEIFEKTGIELAAGRVAGYSAIHKFGMNPACSTSEEDVWGQGGDYQFQTSTSVVRIRAGGNAADTAAGLGARSIRIEGLDGNFNFQTNLLATNGASASLVSTGAFIRVNRAYVVDIGTTAVSATAGGNVGDIVVESTATGHAVISILASRGQSQAALYTIPANKTGWLLSASVNVSGNKPTSIYVYRRENADDFTSPYSSRRVIDGFDELQGFADHPYPIPTILRAKTDIWFTCKTLSGASVTSVDFDIVLENN